MAPDEHGASAPARTSRGERTAARLRAAARTVLADRGYAAARVEDIVAAAGVSHGTFYTYFDNKAGVLDALIDATALELRAVVAEPWDDEAGTAATIERVIARFIEVFADNADVVRVWLEASAHDPHFRQRLRAVRAGYIHRVADQLAPSIKGSGHDPGVAAAALVAMVEGYATQGLSADDPERRSSVAQTLAALWFGGLRGLRDPG